MNHSPRHASPRHAAPTTADIGNAEIGQPIGSGQRAGRTGLHRRIGVGITVLAMATAGWAACSPAATADDFTMVHAGFANEDTVLSEASPASVGLNPGPIAAAEKLLQGYLKGGGTNGHPLFPSYVGTLGHKGKIVDTSVAGQARLYQDATHKLPESEQVAATKDTIYDLASVSKLFTSLASVQLIEEGKLSLNEKVAHYLPEFAANGKQDITVRQLLTHTSGLKSGLPLWKDWPDKASRIKAVMQVAPDNKPGETYLYSDLNLITMGVLVEKLRGEPLDAVVRNHITAPLGMVDTGYNPKNKERTAATEYEEAAGRGMVWGQVHDENAWSLGGVAGHAGVFSTAHDLSILCQALLNGGTYNGHRILSQNSVNLLITDFNEKFPDDSHGLGFELNQRWYMQGMSSPETAGHTGFTGTTLVIDFESQSFAVLLTNSVHPLRGQGTINPARRAWAQGLAMAMPVPPTTGDSAWRTGLVDNTTSTLDLPVASGPAPSASTAAPSSTAPVSSAPASPAPASSAPASSAPATSTDPASSSAPASSAAPSSAAPSSSASDAQSSASESGSIAAPAPSDAPSASTSPAVRSLAGDHRQARALVAPAQAASASAAPAAAPSASGLPLATNLTYDVLVDSEDSDVLTLETSSDGKAFTPISYTLVDGTRRTLIEKPLGGMHMRRWMKVDAQIPAGTTVVRWKMVTDKNYLGRGVYIDNIQVNGGGTRFDVEHHPELLSASGWELAREGLGEAPTPAPEPTPTTPPASSSAPSASNSSAPASQAPSSAAPTSDSPTSAPTATRPPSGTLPHTGR